MNTRSYFWCIIATKILFLLTTFIPSDFNCSIAVANNPKTKPGNSISVYWIGHSLIESRNDTSFGKVSVMNMVEIFAKSQNLGYFGGDQTLWGTPLSVQWSGKRHQKGRAVSRQLTLRKYFLSNAEKYNTLVLTEIVPIRNTIKYEYSPYYLNNFHCAYTNANNSGKVYLYESWIGLQRNKKDKLFIKSVANWQKQMADARFVWNKLAQDASTGNVKQPPFSSWMSNKPSSEKMSTCSSSGLISVIPVGTALATLSKHLLDNSKSDYFTKPDSSRLLPTDLFRNPYVERITDTGESISVDFLNEAVSKKELILRMPNRNWDDIHPSGIGIYFNSLVVFSTLYKTTPVGLPALSELGESLSQSLQRIAWDVVRNDKFSGF